MQKWAFLPVTQPGMFMLVKIVQHLILSI